MNMNQTLQSNPYFETPRSEDTAAHQQNQSTADTNSNNRNTEFSYDDQHQRPSVIQYFLDRTPAGILPL